MLEGVVENGTARNIYTPKYRIAGKTGTARLASGSSGYGGGRYRASFVGYFPAERPLYSCIVVIDNPTNGYYATTVSAPVFREIADKVYSMAYVQYGKPEYEADKTLPVCKNGLKEDFRTIFDELDIDVDPKEKVAKLSVSQMQMIEIAKAFSYDAKIVIMDEPTSSLTEKEVNHLFTIIRKLKERGCGIVYISHKMEEIFQLCDEITVLRDGQWIATQPLEGLDMDKIIAMMVGRSLNQRFPDKENKPGEVILQVRNLTSLRQPSIRDISFDLHKGEILGIAGLVGAKRTDIVETLFGIREKSSGTITLHGKKINNHSANEAINHGFALVTEERRSTGIYAYLDIGFNSLISNIQNYKNKVGLLDNSRMKSDTQWVIDSMRVKTPGHRTQIGSLSGGNQQKVVIGRWLLTQPEILMLDEPTRGIDVGAKFEIYQLIAELAKKDKGIIIISSEMPELLGITDRILVMSNGLVAGIVDTKTTTQNEILRLASLHL